MEKPFVHFDGPNGNWEVVAKGQARSEYTGSGGYGYAFNRPILVQVQ